MRRLYLGLVLAFAAVAQFGCKTSRATTAEPPFSSPPPPPALAPAGTDGRVVPVPSPDAGAAPRPLGGLRSPW